MAGPAVENSTNTHVLIKLPEDVLIRILTFSALSVADVLIFGTADKACSEFVQQSSQLWLDLLSIHFPTQDVSGGCREDARRLRRLFIER